MKIRCARQHAARFYLALKPLLLMVELLYDTTVGKDTVVKPLSAMNADFETVVKQHMFNDC